MSKETKNQWLGKTGRSVAMWLELDVDAVEDTLLNSIHDVADQTRLDWIDLMYRIEAPEAIFHKGELAPTGDLECTHCGTITHIYMEHRLQNCRHCQNEEFVYKDDSVH